MRHPRSIHGDLVILWLRSRGRSGAALVELWDELHEGRVRYADAQIESHFAALPDGGDVVLMTRELSDIAFDIEQQEFLLLFHGPESINIRGVWGKAVATVQSPIGHGEFEGSYDIWQ